MAEMARVFPEIVVNSDKPEEIIPLLLAHLRSFGRLGNRRATWIEDVYSEVLRGIEQGNLRDPAWEEELLDECCAQLNATSPIYHFGERAPGCWGWSASR